MKKGGKTFLNVRLLVPQRGDLISKLVPSPLCLDVSFGLSLLQVVAHDLEILRSGGRKFGTKRCREPGPQARGIGRERR